MTKNQTFDELFGKEKNAQSKKETQKKKIGQKRKLTKISKDIGEPKKKKNKIVKKQV